MSQVFIRGVHGETCQYPSTYDLAEILQQYCQDTQIPLNIIRASQFSKPISKLDPLSRIDLSIKILGGKGGFGSMLKGQGIIARVDNFESCRDLYGRRIRDVNNEIRLKDWKQKQQEKKEAQEERAPEVVIPQKRSKKVDKEFRKSVEKRKNSVAEAFQQGLKKAKF